MFSRFSFQDFIKGGAAAGVEAEMLTEGGFQMNYVLLKKKKENLDVVSSACEIKDLDALKASVNTDTPLCVAITGKGIIRKKSALSENENERSLLDKALPNANPEDFYTQKTDIENNEAIIAVARKTAVDGLLHQFKNAGFFVVDVSIGTKNEMAQMSIKEEKLNERCAVAFASALSYFVSQQEENIFIPEVKQQQNEYRHKRIFQMAGWTVLIFFFSVLLLNFFLFSHYNSRATELKMQVDKNKDDLASIATLQNELQLKQKLLDRLGLKESSKISFYADRIASGLPEEIRLSEMFINPVEKSVNEGKKELNFITKTINISGQCRKSTELNDWIKLLKEKNWIKSVNVLGYTQETSGESGVFQILISVK